MYIGQVNKEELRLKRKGLKLTQAELGKELGVAGNTVARWEQGNMAIPSYLELALLAIENKFVIKNILDKAIENGGSITEDELIAELNKISGFWGNIALENHLKSKNK